MYDSNSNQLDKSYFSGGAIGRGLIVGEADFNGTHMYITTNICKEMIKGKTVDGWKQPFYLNSNLMPLNATQKPELKVATKHLNAYQLCESGTGDIADGGYINKNEVIFIPAKSKTVTYAGKQYDLVCTWIPLTKVLIHCFIKHSDFETLKSGNGRKMHYWEGVTLSQDKKGKIHYKADKGFPSFKTQKKFWDTKIRPNKKQMKRCEKDVRSN